MRPREISSVTGLLWGMGLVALIAAPALAQTRPHTPSDMLLTKHNLSVTGTGSIRALTETRICVFCHAPHNTAPSSPLWNREIPARIYTMYTSPTLKAGPLPPPSGPTKQCLTCHDGTIAMGAVLNPAGGITMAGSDMLPLTSLSNFGLDLSGHHPVSFPYSTALPNSQLVSPPPPDLDYGGADEVHCITCHDPHNDTYGKFLLKDNRFSALCIDCHQMTGWYGSKHATSTASVVGILPRPPKTWPTYTQMGEWGCETCHTPHFAPTAEELLNFTETPPGFSCTTTGCHGDATSPPFHPAAVGGGGAAMIGSRKIGPTNISRQTRKLSSHRQSPGSTGRTARVSADRSGFRDVVCADCHNPHQLTDAQAAAPYASGLLRGSSGVTRSGARIKSVTFEYEVCFKCHGDNTPDLDYVPRVITNTNTRLAFDIGNPSYHPVVGMGRNLDVPSIPSSFEPTMTAATQIYCTTCHADDEGTSRGPHGSTFRPILKERYEMNDYTPENFESYALCYRCHDRNNILRDVSFQKKIAGRTTASGGGHSGHLAAGAPCSACHDAHGVRDTSLAGSGQTGQHTHLINFDTRIVSAVAGKSYPVFTDAGKPFSGSCTLVCHNYRHEGASYP